MDRIAQPEPSTRQIARDAIQAHRAKELDRHAAILVLTEMVGDYGTAILMLTEMVEQFGIESVSRWLRNIAAMQGRDL